MYLDYYVNDVPGRSSEPCPSLRVLVMLLRTPPHKRQEEHAEHARQPPYLAASDCDHDVGGLDGQEGNPLLLVHWLKRYLTTLRISCGARQPNLARRTPELPFGR